jgi:hypothetical protein
MNNFVKGLIFGSGFGLGIVLIAGLVVFALFISPLKFGEPDSNIVGTDALKIQDHRIIFHDGKPIISGTLVNSTEKNLSSVMVEASIFNEDGCFINKEYDYFNLIPPKEKVGFKILFHDWTEIIDEKKMDYKVRITQGYDKQ